MNKLTLTELSSEADNAGNIGAVAHSAGAVPDTVAKVGVGQYIEADLA